MVPLIRLNEFWPFFETSEYRRFDYTSIDNSASASSAPPFTGVFSYDLKTSSMLLSEFSDKGVQKNRWYYQYLPGVGVCEWRDDYPNKTVVLRNPIGWGDEVSVGKTYTNSPRMCPTSSWPPAFKAGRQFVHLEKFYPTYVCKSGDTYDDVLQFAYLQTWGRNETIAGARYLMAKGVGPISVQWIAEVPIGSGVFLECMPLEAKVTSFVIE